MTDLHSSRDDEIMEDAVNKSLLAAQKVARPMLIETRERGYQRGVAAERKRTRRRLSSAVAHALKAIPDGPIRTDIGVLDGEKVRRQLLDAWLDIAPSRPATSPTGDPTDA